jgi:hypothetical protein
VYEDKVSEWSRGEYSGGVIRMRGGLEGDFAPVLAEETVHAFNEETLNFDNTSSTWLDEGIAGYTQAMVRKKLSGESKTRTLFGEERSYSERRDGSLYKITKPSKGDKQKLWQYYQDNMSFMKHWNPQKSENRDFGYAYSELIIRNYVSQNNSIRKLYNQLNPQKIKNNEEKWRKYSEILDLKPCNYSSRKKFDSCLERINKYDYPVYYASKLPGKNTTQIKIEEVKIPETKPLASQGLSRSLEVTGDSLINKIRNILQNIAERYL